MEKIIMEKIIQVFNKIIEKINNFIKYILKSTSVTMLEKENYYIYKIANPQIVDEYEGRNIDFGKLKEAT